MAERNTDARRIAEEAVGERPASAIPETARQRVAAAPSPAAAPAGPRASLAARTAEAVGEREGGAYADATMEEAQRRSRQTVGRSSQAHVARWLSDQFGPQPLVVMAAFGLGYLAASVVNRRR
jgi:hypothetical protein